MKPLMQIVPLMILLSIPSVSLGQTELEEHAVTLADYIESNPNCLTKEIIYDGCTLMINSDGEYLFGQFNILHPELQMRILMQGGVTFFIDPTGKKKEKYALHFPAASSVKDKMPRMTPPKTGDDMPTETLPDISPLVMSLSALGADYEINGISQPFPQIYSSISLDGNTHCLSYSFILPIEKMLSEKKLSENWRIGLYSETGNPSDGSPGLERPDFGGQRFEVQRDMPENTRQAKTKSKANLREMMMNDIEVWIPFSFSQICSISQSKNEK